MNKIAKRAVLGTVFMSIFSLCGWYGWHWWETGAAVESTDNAYVHAEITAISPKIAGYVAEVSVADNQAVEAGAVLVRIADEDYRAQRDRAQAAVARAEAAIANLEQRKNLQWVLIREADAATDLAKTDVELTRRELDRSNKLINQGWASHRNHDLATASAERAGANLAKSQAAAAAAREQIAVLDTEARQARAGLDDARAALNLAKIALGETIIRAPVAGVVGNRRVRAGEFVRPGMVLASVVPVESSWVVANFKETQVSRMRIGQPVHVRVDGYEDMPIEGEVDSLAPASGAAFSLLPPDNATGNFIRIVQRVPVKIRLQPNHSLLGRLVPGLSADVVVDTRSKPNSDAVALAGPSSIFKVRDRQ
ncbi:HlyD family secretion protein [Labrys sp. ZIDIC5]|uniref:HlyD family secretion protein n=1 Tax=Labrys sedimenti TaxID=3106036 RepID=UPI002ACAE4DD|nr:HlyD family secretion protein [Labrys sp. ZIDIC5]MDZ5454428.1 HlyD family secretion protein [Labrys sp. ZIDIC5]